MLAKVLFQIEKVYKMLQSFREKYNTLSTGKDIGACFQDLSENDTGTMTKRGEFFISIARKKFVRK